jgi:ADP-heptose:LPS heptosyltransferase
MIDQTYVEFGGGLGDVFSQIYSRGDYRALSRIPDGERVSVGLVTHNPHVRELFENHPNRHKIDLHEFGYWLPPHDAERRAALGVPVFRWAPAVAGSKVEFYPTTNDYAVCDGAKSVLGSGVTQTTRYVVVAMGAGTSARNLPDDSVKPLARIVSEAGYRVVQVGRNYQRDGKSPEPYLDESVVYRSLIDRLSVPGTAHFLSNAKALITAHSALSILAWHMRIPQLLLYPESVSQRHFQRSDPWSFGAFDPELSVITAHGSFRDHARANEKFLSFL